MRNIIKTITKPSTERLSCLIIAFAFIFMFGSISKTQAQNSTILQSLQRPPVNVQSPNAASLGLYGQIPVSYYTGVPNISVPLYTVKNKKVTVPIEISYHASGFRPDMHPGWVGMGWSLNAGGMISRTIKGMPDDFNNNNDGGARGYYFKHNTLNSSTWNQTSFLTNLMANFDYSDTEPDEFSFSFNGYSGSFFLASDGSWKVKCDRPVKVEFNNVFIDVPFSPLFDTDIFAVGYSKTFSGFTITTDDGTQYVFGNTSSTSAIEYSLSFFRQGYDYWKANSWYLTKIIEVSGDEINFSYERDSFVNQMYESLYMDLGSKVSTTNGPFTIAACETNTPTNYPTSYARAVDGQLVSPVYLTQISSKTVNINFNRSNTTELRYPYSIYDIRAGDWSTNSPTQSFLPFLDNSFATTGNITDYQPSIDQLQWKKLNTIQIKQPDGTLMKSYSFTYNNNSNERLTLLSVTEMASDNEPTTPWRFFYDQSQPLPGYFEHKTDHWGFYNGTFADISNTSTNYLTYFNYRQPNAAYLYAGTLNKIAYPTGGLTEFTYEPNTYDKQVQLDRSLAPSTNADEQLAGGLRIKRISSYDPASANPKNTKEYFYLNNYFAGATGSGVLGGQIKYYFDDYQVHASNDYNTIYYKSIFTSQSVLPGCTNISGSQVGYTSVEEKRQDGSVTIYNYSNYDNGRTDEHAESTLQPNRSQYEPYNSNDEERGKLISQQSYNGTGQLVYSKAINYTAINKSTDFVPAIKANLTYLCGEPELSGYAYIGEATAYKLYSYSYLPSQEIETSYSPNGGNGIATTKTYSYTTVDRLLQIITTTTSENKNEIISYQYPRQLAQSESPAGVYTAMVGKNILSPVITETKALDTDPVYQKFNHYQETSTGIFSNTSVDMTIGNGPTVPKINMTYDEKGNITSASKPGGATTCYVWGYNSLYPVATIDNANYTAVENALGGTTAVRAFRDQAYPTTVTATLDPLRTDPNLSAAHVSTYTYHPIVGMLSQTNSQGELTTYEYDNFLRLKNVKDLNDNIVKNYTYHIKPILYFNADISATVTKTNCLGSSAGGNVTYTVPSGKYYSFLSQADADAQAVADLDANKQTYANSQNACVIYARYETENATYNEYADQDGGDHVEITGDVYIRFYADAACTVSTALPYNTTIHGKQINSYSTFWGNYDIPAEFDYLASQGQTQYSLGNYILTSFYNLYPAWQNTNYTFQVIADPTNPYIVPESTHSNN